MPTSKRWTTGHDNLPTQPVDLARVGALTASSHRMVDCLRDWPAESPQNAATVDPDPIWRKRAGEHCAAAPNLHELFVFMAEESQGPLHGRSSAGALSIRAFRQTRMVRGMRGALFRKMAGERGSAESVADTPDGAERIPVAGLAQFLAETPDMDIDCALLNMDVPPPDPIKKLRA